MLKTTKYRKIKNLNICSMDWKKSIFFKWVYKFNLSPIKILRKKKLSIKEIILKFIWKSEEAEPTLRKQDRVEGLTVHTLNSLRSESNKDSAVLAHRSLAQGWTHRAMGQTCRCCCQVASVAPNAVWPHRQQPTRLPRPCDAPGKNAGVGCHFLLQGMKVKSESEGTDLGTQKKADRGTANWSVTKSQKQFRGGRTIFSTSSAERIKHS